MLVAIDCGRVIPILPECALSQLAPVELLPGAAGDELHTARDITLATILHQEVDVVGRHHIVEDAESKPLLGFEQPSQVAAPITGELEKKRPLVAAVRDMPDVPRNEMAVCTRHGDPQRRGFDGNNARLRLQVDMILGLTYAKSAACAGPTRN